MNNEAKLIEQFKSSVPVDLDQLLACLGVGLERSSNLDPDISGELERGEHGQFVIRVNASHSLVRQRFTIAHELGHYMLHRVLIGKGVDDNKAYRSDDVGNFYNKNILPEHETQANQFAASLLMPADQVRSVYDRMTSLSEMALHFSVSKSAMDVRLRSLSLSPLPI